MSYSGDDEGLDLSWSSDLKDAQAQRNGTTVGGTTEDDYGDERTESLPATADPDEMSETQIQIVETSALHPEATTGEIAEIADCDQSYVSMTLSEHYPERSPGPCTSYDSIEIADCSDEVLAVVPDGTDPSSMSKLQYTIVEFAVNDQTATSYEIADQIDCARSHVNRTLDEYHPDHTSSGAVGRNPYTEDQFRVENMSELTDLQKEILELAENNPSQSQRWIAASVGCGNSYVGQVLREHLPEHSTVKKQDDTPDEHRDQQSTAGDSPVCDTDRLQRAKTALTTIKFGVNDDGVCEQIQYVIEILEEVDQ